MSTRHTSTPLQMVPEQGTYFALATAAEWADPAWTEVFAATANEIYLAGFSWNTPLIGTSHSMELQFGVGEAGEEELIHTYRIERTAQVNTATKRVMFPVPLGNIPAGVRLCVRLRSSHTGSRGGISLMYYENLTSEHKNPAPMKCWPSGEGSFSLAWENTSWGNSDWLEITPGEDVEVTLVDAFLGLESPHINCAAEIDISKGAAGSENLNIVTTKRFFHSAVNPQIHLVFPGGLPFVAGTRLSFRVRRADVNPSAPAGKWSFNYVYETQYLS